jgi:hypothetical protein
MMAPNICGCGVKLAIYHPFGAYNFGVASRFLENLYIPASEYIV